MRVCECSSGVEVEEGDGRERGGAAPSSSLDAARAVRWGSVRGRNGMDGMGPLPASSHATYAFGESVARPDASRITGLVAQHVVGASRASFPASPECGRSGSSWAS